MKFSTWFAAAMLIAAGCAVPDRPSSAPDLSQPGVGGGGGDDGGAADLSTASDFAVAADLSGHDLASPADLAVVHDLATPPDLTTAPDLANICMPPVAGGACGDYPPQCGCATGQNCAVVNNSNGATGCVAAGSVPNWNGGCTGSGAAQCGVGSQCIGGVCTPICKTATDCGGGYNTCGGVVSGGNPVPGLTVCSRTCDPVNPQSGIAPYSACGPNVACYPASDHGSFCLAPVGSGTQASDCTTGTSSDYTKCAAGFVCLQDVPAPFYFSSCYKLCHVGSNADCTGSLTCGSFATKQYAGPTEIGYCS